jgi:hypothetical protein
MAGIREGGARISRPQRKSRPTAALLEHSEAPALPSQQKCIDEFRAAEAVRNAEPHPADEVQIHHQTRTQSSHATPSAGPSDPPSLSLTPIALDGPEKRQCSQVTLTISEDDSEREDARNNPRPSGKYLRKGSISEVLTKYYQQNEPAKLPWQIKKRSTMMGFSPTSTCSPFRILGSHKKTRLVTLTSSLARHLSMQAQKG